MGLGKALETRVKQVTQDAKAKVENTYEDVKDKAQDTRKDFKEHVEKLNAKHEAKQQEENAAKAAEENAAKVAEENNVEDHSTPAKVFAVNNDVTIHELSPEISPNPADDHALGIDCN